MVSLQKLSPALANELKTVRLRALADTPTAFTGTYADESRLSDEDWSRRATTWSSGPSTCYLAMDTGDPCGIIAGKCDEEEPQRAWVLSMWVAPAHRRTGLATTLMRSVESWAIGLGLRELRLHVTSNNQAAQIFYERCGFTLTGAVQPYPHDPALTESEMVKSLPASGR
jgi:ribosomal protein S18 acetylase RimI-like enzyme